MQEQNIKIIGAVSRIWIRGIQQLYTNPKDKNLIFYALITRDKLWINFCIIWHRFERIKI